MTKSWTQFIPSAFGTLILATALLAGCASHGGNNAQSSSSPDWRLVPEATVLGQKRQFFLYGRRLDSAAITAPPSVLVEKGAVKHDGRVMALYLTASALRPDSLAKGEKKGSREIRVQTPDTTAVFQLQIVDEAQVR